MLINCNTIKLEHFYVTTVGETKQIQAIQQQNSAAGASKNAY